MRILSTVGAIFILICSTCLAQQKAWPTTLNSTHMAKVIEVKADGSNKIYKSSFFQFVSDSKLEKNDIRRIATAADSVHYALKKIPLNLIHLPRFDQDRTTHSIYIYDNIRNYDKAVGVKFSAGYYSKAKREVYLRKDHFLTSSKPNYQLLVHELTHLNMHGLIRYSNAWFTEGTAEYMASAYSDQGTGSYNFTNITTNIRTRIQTFITSKETIILPKLETLITLNDKTWAKQNADLPPEERYIPYIAALITTHYFFHLDPEGREKINTYIKNLTSNNKNQRAQAQQTLFKNTNLKTLQKNLTTYWKKKGLKITFQD